MLSHGKTMMGKQKVASGFVPQDDLYAIVSFPSCSIATASVFFKNSNHYG